MFSLSMHFIFFEETHKNAEEWKRIKRGTFCKNVGLCFLKDFWSPGAAKVALAQKCCFSCCSSCWIVVVDAFNIENGRPGVQNL